jgi:hypothetical protein
VLSASACCANSLSICASLISTPFTIIAMM